MATASVKLELHNSQFLAGLARSRAAVAGLGASVSSIGAAGLVKGLAAGAAGVVALGTAAAYGIKKAFDFGGQLADMSAISGRSVTNILLMKRALQDAGVSMEKIDRYLLTGQDRGGLIEKAMKSISASDWADAAKSIGSQATLLEKNAKTFDRVSDLLGRSGDKLRGFFVGAADSIGKALLPILERFDKMDFASQGQKFGDGLLVGAQALAGFFKNPETLFKSFEDGFTAVVLGIGNTMAAVFTKALSVLQAGAQAAFEFLLSPNTIQGWRKSINSALIELAGKNMSGGLNSIGRSLQKQIDEGEAAAAGSDKTSFPDRMLAIANEAPLEVNDIFFAKEALKNAQAGLKKASGIGRNILPPGMEAGSRNKLEESQQAAAAAIGRITFAGEGSGLGQSTFANRDMAAGDELATRWGQPKPSDVANSKGDKNLEKIAAGIEKQTAITEKAWGE